MIPSVAPPPPPMPTQSALTQQAGAASQATIPDPKGRGGRRRSPLNRRGRRHLEGEMRRSERQEFRSQVQAEIDFRAIRSSSALANQVRVANLVATEKSTTNGRRRRFAKVVQSFITRAKNKSEKNENNS